MRYNTNVLFLLFCPLTTPVSCAVLLIAMSSDDDVDEWCR